MEPSSALAGRRGAARCVALVLAVALPAAGCGEEGSAADGAPGSAGRSPGPEAGRSAAAQAFPSGWRVRTDPGATSPDAVNFVATDRGYRVRPGPRAIYWDPEMRAEGSYRVQATFRHFNEPSPPEAYGLFVGGRDLQSPDQEYLYFLIRRDGKYLVKRRAGAETHVLVDWTSHGAVETGPAEGGSPANTLAVEAGEETVRFLVNGTEVERLPRGRELDTDGQVGVRVNHKLDVRFTDPRVEPLGDTAPDGGG